MSDKRYYWLRLHDDFFNSKRIKKMRKLPGGDTLTIIYLKMQLLAMKTDGILTWTGLEEDFSEELALDLDEDPESVKMAMVYLLSCGLAETDDNISYFFPYAISNTGSENASTQRVREHRERQKLLHCNADVTEMKHECNAEIEIEKEKEKKVRHRYGEYANVLLTDDDLEKLKTEFSDWQQRIDRLSAYMESTGKSYKNHLATIRNWARKDKPEKEDTFSRIERLQREGAFDEP